MKIWTILFRLASQLAKRFTPSQLGQFRERKVLNPSFSELQNFTHCA